MDEFLKFKSELYQRKSKRKLFVVLFEDKGKDKNKDKSIQLDALLVYDDRYIKTKIKTNSDKVYTNFHGLNMSKDGV